MMEKKWNKIVIFSLFSSMVFVLMGCGSPKEVALGTQVSVNYRIKDIVTEEVIGDEKEIKNFLLDDEKSLLFEALKGLKKGGTVEATLLDPWKKHDVTLVEKYPEVLINTIGVNSDIGEYIDYKGTIKGEVIEKIMEEGVTKYVLDANPSETRNYFTYVITLVDIKN